MELQLPITDKYIVEQFIPQRFPFVMVDALLNYTETELLSGLTIVNDLLFVKNNFFQEAGLIEHLAQSIALHKGYSYYLQNQSAPTGYIGSIKQITIYRYPKIGEQLLTKVSVLHEFMGVTLVQLESSIQNECIALGEMKTVLAK
ncbi:hypothetical protein [Capnocytophaga catalasegens]|uniref:3-hydroxymyristoyl/3-hydroxydecanoyl-(Acyl carrier protein) dehydratase n=1 Tax=Capnocytophaga catalasegens TaxID=1004260 RepID=A0AAV5ATX2_9FLAO|nr:hypothetical protein [Capnocytophaga catalasegens]GIZ14539.1 hypothetical protein RCZ03_05400 [Capnocytophaga catalasegens]GJM50741.1 hypothetical protein RCZ15_17140 [Capnocytophaga catalasegens]GJM51894.1 hypothetical protein RCZ16_02120 [Capnocytophaga catalasegens]